MIPIVFCASFIPWPNENAAAETSWTLRNALSSGSGRALPEDPRRGEEEDEAEERCRAIGDRTMKTSVLTRPFAHEDARARLHDGRAGEPADEGVRGRGREAPPPRQEVPDDRADERREDEERVHDGRVHDVLADRLRDARLERERRDEVEERRPGDGQLRRQDARPDDGRDRVRGVVEAVDEVEGERDEDDEEDEAHRRPALRRTSGRSARGRSRRPRSGPSLPRGPRRSPSTSGA